MSQHAKIHAWSPKPSAPPPQCDHDRIEQMLKVQTEALELFARKNADYGDAFAN